MLAEPIGGDVPLWGSHGFPYRCGVTERDFVLWALNASTGTVDDSLHWAQSVGTMLQHFCRDCPLSAKLPALYAGRCIEPVIRSYHGGGRPPRPVFGQQLSLALESVRDPGDQGQRSTVRQARSAYSYAAPPEGSDGRAA